MNDNLLTEDENLIFSYLLARMAFDGYMPRISINKLSFISRLKISRVARALFGLFRKEYIIGRLKDGVVKLHLEKWQGTQIGETFPTE